MNGHRNQIQYNGNWGHLHCNRRVCIQIAWSRNKIGTVSLKAKIYRSVLCNRDLKHEMRSTVFCCHHMFRSWWPPGHDQDNHSASCDIDLVNHSGIFSDIRLVNSHVSFSPPLLKKDGVGLSGLEDLCILKKWFSQLSDFSTASLTLCIFLEHFSSLACKSCRHCR